MKHHSISVREKLTALAGAATLAFTAWGYGGVIAWSLHVMLAGGLTTLFIALAPAPTSFKRPIASFRFPSRSWQRLAVSPAGYLAGLFLLYLVLAALNPAWRLGGNYWVQPMVPLDPPLASWLPTSVKSNYEPMNAWRIIHMHIAAFSLALGLSLGLMRRRTVLFVLWFTVANITAMASVAIVMSINEADKVLWSIQSANRHFWGSFFYRNQGVAFLNWGMVLAGMLFFYHARRTAERGQSGGPHFLAFCFGTLILVSVMMALSRGGILFGGILFFVFLLLVLFHYLRIARETPISISLPLFMGVLLLGGVTVFQVNRLVDWAAVEHRFGNLEDSAQNLSSDNRVLTSKMTWEMAKDQLWTGWGAGSFRYAFPKYQKQESGIYLIRMRGEKKLIRGYRYAHNDILQFLAEYGMIGCCLLLIAIGALVLPAVRSFSSAAAFLHFGMVAAAGHAFVDFIFHSPAVWVAFVGGIALSARLLGLEAKRDSV